VANFLGDTRRHGVYGENLAISARPYGNSPGVLARYSFVRGTVIRGPALRSICLAESRRSLCSPPCYPILVLFGLRHLGQNSLCDAMFLIQSLSKCISADQNAHLHATRFSLPGQCVGSEGCQVQFGLQVASTASVCTKSCAKTLPMPRNFYWLIRIVASPCWLPWRFLCLSIIAFRACSHDAGDVRCLLFYRPIFISKFSLCKPPRKFLLGGRLSSWNSNLIVH